MAMTEEELIMREEMRSTLMDAIMKRGRMQQTQSIDPGFSREIPEGTPPSIPMPSPRVPQGYENPETMDPGFTRWQYPPGTHRPRVQSEAEQMDQYYSPDEKRRMLEEFWLRRDIGRELGQLPPQQGNMVPIPIARPGEGGNYAPIPGARPGEGGEMVPMPNAIPGDRFSIGDLIRSFKESENQF